MQYFCLFKVWTKKDRIAGLYNRNPNFDRGYAYMGERPLWGGRRWT